MLLDVGFLGNLPFLPESMPLGISIQNIGSGFKVNKDRSDSDVAPTELKIGTGFELMTGKMRLSTDISQIVDSKLAIGIGLEYGIMNNIVQLRGGYKYKIGGMDLGTMAGLRLGFGVVFYDTNIDYAFAPQGDLGITHRVSLGYKFGADIMIGQKAGVINLESKEIAEAGEEVVRVRKEIMYFSPTDDTITDEHKVIFGKIQSLCKENPDFSIKIEGHNDIRETNKVSRTRTENVKKALVALGIKEDKITIKWYGSSKPVSTAITSEGLAHNRRVEIILWGKESIKQ
jgi:outer membrane protein OmpA-like peptidoglycan-associated protein